MLATELEQNQQQDTAWCSGRRFRILAWTAIAIPPIYFYILAFRSLSSLPFLDDYDAPLAFLLRWKRERGLQHLVEIVTWQHNEYREWFLNSLFGTQYLILGHVDIKAIAILGNLFVLLLLGILFLVWRRGESSRDFTLLAFVPVSWMLFQLQYASAMNVPMQSLQHFPAILFGMLACLLASMEGRPAFAGALCALFLTVASSGNGLFIIPVGSILFLQQKKYVRLTVWLATGAAICFLYFDGYNFHASQTHADHSLLSSFKHLSPAYGASFLGSIATATNPVPAILLGSLLLVAFMFATRDRVFASNPALYYSALFFFVTALAVSGLRSDGGLTTALGSRYRINSTMIVILTYLYLMDKYRNRILRWKQPMATAVVCVAGVLLIGFNVASDRAGSRYLVMRRAKLEAAILRWEHHEPPKINSIETGDDYTARSEMKGYYEPRVAILVDALKEGIYSLPDLPEQH